MWNFIAGKIDTIIAVQLPAQAQQWIYRPLLPVCLDTFAHKRLSSTSSYILTTLPMVWSSRCIVNVAACGTLVSFSCEILTEKIEFHVEASFHQLIADRNCKLTFVVLQVQQTFRICPERSWLCRFVTPCLYSRNPRPRNMTLHRRTDVC